MYDARTLAIPADHRELTVEIDGAAVPRAHHLLGLSITKVANKLPTARLVYADGHAASSDFPLSNQDLLIPGKRITIKAGSSHEQHTVFEGIIVKQSLKLHARGNSQMIVDCRHLACRLTVGRKSAYFAEQTDGEAITQLLERAGLAAAVEATAVTHECLVQWSCTDWDFLLARAAANGMLVLCTNEGVSVQAPRLAGPPVAELLYGATLLELDVTMDAREQVAAIHGRTWDLAEQSTVEVQAVDPGLEGPGNLGSAQLASVLGLEHLALHHAALSEPEAQAWADASWLLRQLGRVSGRVKCEGIATLEVGDIVKLSGVGERFSGNVYLTGVRHDLDTAQGWKTHAQFGSVEPPPTRSEDASAPKAGALLPGVSGLQIGIVVGNEDPRGEHRVRVRLPLVDPDDEGIWARVACLDAGDDRGTFFRPELGDEVVLGFLAADPRSAIILGMLHSSAKPAPWAGTDANPEKGYRSRSKLELHFNDEKRVLTLGTPAGNTLTLSEERSAISLADQNGNCIEMNADGVRIKSTAAIVLEATTAVRVESGTSVGISAGGEAKLEGTAGVELSSPATAVIKGCLVRIN